MKKMTTLAIICILAISCSEHETTSSNHSSVDVETPQSSVIPDEEKLVIEKKNDGYQTQFSPAVELEVVDELLYAKFLHESGEGYTYRQIDDYTLCCAAYENINGSLLAVPQKFDGTLSLAKGTNYILQFFVRQKEAILDDDSIPTGRYRYYVYQIPSGRITFNDIVPPPGERLRNSFDYICSNNDEVLSVSFESATYEFHIVSKERDGNNKKHSLSAHAIGSYGNIYISPMKNSFVEGEEIEVDISVVTEVFNNLMCNDFHAYTKSYYRENGAEYWKFQFPPFDVTLSPCYNV